MRIHPDALESEWDSEDKSFTVGVCCLEILSQEYEMERRSGTGLIGLILVPCPTDPVSYRRVGHFWLRPSEDNPFAGVVPEVVTIV